jgi:Ca-activated chloride channel family protein
MLLLLALLPLLVRRWRQGERATLRYPQLAGLREVGVGRRPGWRWSLTLLRGLALVALVVGLARPQLGKSATQIFTEGIDIMLAVDVSSSMLAEDFDLDGEAANRLQAVQGVVKDFVEQRVGDRIGLVLFAARPYLQSPLTLDHGWLLNNLGRAEIGMIEDGTAVGSALATAVNGLEGSEAESKIVILLTDGQSNAGKVSPLTAAEAAKTLGYKVYTIGAGTRGVARYPSVDMFGNKRYVPMQVDIDEKTLKEIAAVTGGRYYRATDTESLQEIYAEIDQLEKSPQEGLLYLDYHELYPWLVIPALMLLATEAILAQTWLRVLP